ncbi:MAG: FxsA family protein [Endozoicomonadaceae bacterium]|nr:FxsA family protein [Endozoicomonadaceae bacterium]
MRFAFLSLVLFPIAEIMVLIKIGSLIGVLVTVLLLLFTASLGIYLLREQGIRTLLRARERMMNGQVVGQEMLEGVIIVACGVLLVAPGFITDTIALIGFFPVTRRCIVDRILASHQWRASAYSQTGFDQSNAKKTDPFEQNAERRPEIIEGEFRREE